jgi:deoxyribodipyrimidine photo-lyase
MKRALFWFRTDLRLNDNPALQAALRENDEIIPVYILDERFLQQDEWGIRRTGPFRLKFLLESLTDLREHLKEVGSNLIFHQGTPEEYLPQIAAEYDCNSVFASKEYTQEEIKTEKAVAEKLELNLFHSSTLIHPDDIPFQIEDLPEVFTVFRKKVEKYSEVRPPIPTPEKINSPDLPPAEIPDIEALEVKSPPEDKRSAIPFKGGALEAFQRLDHYFWGTEAVSTYKKTRNGLMGTDYSTKFSPWLANGSISPRRIYHELEQYESEVEKNQSTYWVKFELLWRDFFKYVAMRYGKRIFWPGGIKGKSRVWKDNDRLFEKWISGNTGDPFVDANMRELLYTGWMSNRGRQNVASYLVYQMKQDWRKGAAWFESLLVDYDPASNYGNWMYAAGVGNDPRDRVFNTKRQADMYDKKGEFQQLWLNGKAQEPYSFMESYLL